MNADPKPLPATPEPSSSPSPNLSPSMFLLDEPSLLEHAKATPSTSVSGSERDAELQDDGEDALTAMFPDSKDVTDEKYGFDKLGDYRWATDNSCLELQVHWLSGEITWEREDLLHADCRVALLRRWKDEKGGRPTNPEDPDSYAIFAIKKHKTKRSKLLVRVEWVGYDDATWESETTIREAAPDLVDEYFKHAPSNKRKRAEKSEPRKKSKV